MSQKHQTALSLDRRRLLKILGGSTLAAALSGFAGGIARRARGEFDLPPLMATRLTQDYGLEVPIVSAGMGFVAMPQLVAAVSNAGGLGVLGNAIEPPPSTQLLIQMVKTLTSRPFGVDFFLANSALGPATVDAHIDVAIAEQVPLVVFHFDTPPKSWVDALHEAGIRVWAQVPSVDDAIHALLVGVDALICQGVEAGGHNKSKTPLKQLVRDITRETDKMVLAAGGIATGGDMINALLHGAEGVWCGTRFVASEEAYAHEGYKGRLVEAQKPDTVITRLFGPELPCEPYRVLRTQVVDANLANEDELCDDPPHGPPIGTTVLFPFTFKVPYVMPQFSAVVPTPDTVGDLEQMGLPASEAVHKIGSIKPAARIITDMMLEALESLADAGD
jgi:NAD(P)H-dependent flavin oxidoreductase YrpB (nitropropane dioxygenase family)